MSELWKSVQGYEGLYEVSSEGRVRSKAMLSNGGHGCTYLREGRILRPQLRRHGYLGVWLYTGESKKQVSVHRLVAEAFCERKDGQTEVNHLNEDKQDNRAINLAWCTRSENCAYGEKLAAKRRMSRNNSRSKPIKQFTLSGELVAEYPSLHEAERKTGFSVKNIHHALKNVQASAYGYAWKYATE